MYFYQLHADKMLFTLKMIKLKSLNQSSKFRYKVEIMTFILKQFA